MPNRIVTYIGDHDHVKQAIFVRNDLSVFVRCRDFRSSKSCDSCILVPFALQSTVVCPSYGLDDDT